MSSRRPPPRYTAATADRHELYQLAVQSPERDARFLSRYVRKVTGKPLRRLREDFCGTALLSCWFVKLHRDNHAVGVDLHWQTLAWGRIHNVRRLLDRDQQRRLLLRRADVRSVRRPRVQAVAALNFSYSVFDTRADLRRWFRACHAALEPGGLLFVDAWGGPDVQAHATDRTRLHGFDYLWEQRAFDPISHRIECAIHFEFRDGTALRDAFVYDWRLWTMPELRETMAEAGFTDVHVLWEGTDARTGRGNGVFRRKAVGDADAAWIVYVVGQKPGAPRRRRLALA
jgi:SAM-dependent methyltransferase